MEKSSPEEEPGPLSPKERQRRQRIADTVARAKMLRIMGTYSYIGIEFGVAVVFGWFAGNWLDDYFETAPTFRFLMMALGMAAAFRDLFRLVKNTDLDRMDDP